MTTTPRSLCAIAVVLTLGIAGAAHAQQSSMSFFVTSAAIGKGADLGGLEGADRHCQQLAQSAGAGSRTWHAYLSTQAADGKPAVNARDRIGKGPWQNAKGVVVAKDVDELHGQNNLTKQTSARLHAGHPHLKTSANSGRGQPEQLRARVRDGVRDPPFSVVPAQAGRILLCT